jgi:hypothetical protein
MQTREKNSTVNLNFNKSLTLNIFTVAGLEKKTLFAVFLLMASTFILFYKFLLPAKVQIIIEGSVVEIVQIPALYPLNDTIIIATMAFVMGASTIYLLMLPPYHPSLTSPILDKTKLERWKANLESLTDKDEYRLYQLVMEESGITFQGKLVEKSGFPKSKVSLALDRLEARGLLERKRHGMSNIVILK